MIVVVDISLLFYRHLHRTAYSVGDHVYDLDQKWVESLKKDSFKSIMYDIRQYGNNIDKLIIAKDQGKSWRYDLKDEYINIKYKSTDNRKKNRKKINSQVLNKAIEHFCQEMETFGMCSIGFDSMEGDDIIYLVTKHYYEKQIPSIIITSDKDLIQLVKVNNNVSNFITIYDGAHKKKYHYITESFMDDNTKKPADIMDIFSTDINTKHPGLEKVLKYHSMVDTKKSLLTKIMVGDTSDNIPPSMTFQMKNKTHKFSKINANKVFDHNPWVVDIEPNDLWENRDTRLKLAKAMFNVKTTCNNYRAITDAVDAIKRNMYYMWLNDVVYKEFSQQHYYATKQHVLDKLTSAAYFGDYSRGLQSGDLTKGTMYNSETGTKYF